VAITVGARRSNCKLLGYGQQHQSWYGAIDGAKFGKCLRETQCALLQVTVDKRKQWANHVIGLVIIRCEYVEVGIAFRYMCFKSSTDIPESGKGLVGVGCV
jgi:hypothetical protein